MHYHMMGIGGIGVSALARFLKHHNHRVSGCDSNATGAEAVKLQSAGFEVLQGHSPNHIGSDVDALIISTAIPMDHPEVLAALERNIPVQYRIQVLGDLLETATSVGVIGTHGKTTTSSMIAVALLGAGLDPSALIGSTLLELGGSNMRIGTGPLVAELDESDPRFQDLRPKICVLTNLEADHIGLPGDLRPNFSWESLEQLQGAFEGFCSHLETVIYCLDWDKANLQQVSSGAKKQISYGLKDGADYQAVNVQYQDFGSSFTVLHEGLELGRVHLNVPGEYNLHNALAALTVCDLLGADFAQAAAALERFSGAGRRFDHKGTLNGALIVDDYAHHPTEVAVLLEAAQRSGRRVRVVFQPHRYLRTAQSWLELAHTLMPADEVILLDIYAAGETPIAGIHAQNISTAMQAKGHPSAHYLGDFETALNHLELDLHPNDLILTVGAGSITTFGPMLLERARIEGEKINREKPKEREDGRKI